ncbi:YihY/virulence factor BrkB family protein [Flavobacterium cellulosilyticum]|uniref:YihY/virulence factor BrkB family protein n=1 Tax=Flavobacterium cellulosilyticum TaxID=2541731 RepID=A0A4V2YZP7_9FLAO|nr:YihY/virulence factor BrkB family protein [Flavobacterium cellulosilyticum]TDD98017.1 YihY/virulence factor BrkB family protein [Flavobacterium cellulosilyticum]
MSKEIEERIKRVRILRKFVYVLKRIKLPWLYQLSLYDLLELYLIGIVEGALSYRASAIAFSFFMALFPFALFILNLIPYIPIEGFQQDFLKFVEHGVPPHTYEAIAIIINDILNNSHTGLISWGIVLSILLMTNGLTAVLGGFENSHHIIIKRGFIQQYLVALAMSLLLSFLLLFTVAIILIFEVFIQKFKMQNVFTENIPFIQLGRFAFLILMILITTSILFRFGTKHHGNQKPKFISIGSVFTTILIILSSYFFGIWVIRFSKYNQLYGSIGTLLIMMFYIWINCMVLLLGFELNASINKLRRNFKKD